MLCDDLEGWHGGGGRGSPRGRDMCLQAHGLTYKSTGSRESPWAHIQVHGLAYKSTGSHTSPWACSELDMTSHLSNNTIADLRHCTTETNTTV